MVNFHVLAKSREPRCVCRRVQKLLYGAATKKRGNNDTPAQLAGILLTPDTLKDTLNHGVVTQLLRCLCDICKTATLCTPPQDDHDLAKDIAAKGERRELTAALVFTGGTFALRLLAGHNLHSIEATLSHMRDRLDLTRALFHPFERHRTPASCQHTDHHDSSESIQCLTEHFVHQLHESAMYSRVPTFKADNLLQHFSDRQNLPFIEDTQLQIGRRDGHRSFYQFKIHDSFRDEKLKDRSLFRKQINLSDDEARRQAEQESAVLKVLKELAHPNIAEVLFAFQEEQPPRLSLVFDFHPSDLNEILFPTEKRIKMQGEAQLRKPDRIEDRFPGSILNHWLWFGLLDIFDAVAAVHEPLLKSLQQNANSKWLGAHFDIKPANIIITVKGRFLLTDFGLTYFKQFNVEPEQETNFTVMTGTAMYAPPPSYGKRKAEYADNSNDQIWWRRNYDVWSLACVACELLAHLVDPEDDPTKFRRERRNQENFGFWTYEPNNSEVVKDAVSRRLESYRKSGDAYLSKVAEQIHKMFSLDRKTRTTVKECQRELSVGFTIDRYLLQDPGDMMIAGPGTHSHLSELRTSFTTGRIISPLRCSLYLWRNTASGKVKLDVEFSGSNHETFIVPNWTQVNRDEFLAQSLFDPNMLYEENVLRTNGLFLECAFRSMHDGFVFHFARRDDYYHFFGAVTHQLVDNKSEFRFRRCKIKSRRSFLSQNRWEASSGHLHVWRELGDEDYRTVYINKMGVQPQTVPEVDTYNSRVPYRLALYLCDEESSSRVIALISLNHHGFLIRFDHSQKTGPRMHLVRRSGKDIWGTFLQVPTESTSKLDPAPAPYPGIPLNGETITDRIEKSGGFEQVELTFYTAADSRKFQEFYNNLNGE